MKIEDDALQKLFAGTDWILQPALFRDLWNGGWLASRQAIEILPHVWDMKDAQNALTVDEWTGIFEELPPHNSAGEMIEIEGDLTVWRWGNLDESKDEAFGIEWTDRAPAMMERDLASGYHDPKVLYVYKAKGSHVAARYGEEGAYRYIFPWVDADEVKKETN